MAVGRLQRGLARQGNFADWPRQIGGRATRKDAPGFRSNRKCGGQGNRRLAAATQAADVIITATGSPAILYPDMIKEGAVVVDAGVASEDGKTVGDVAPEVYNRQRLNHHAAQRRVGPLTVCAPFDNVIRAARAKAN